MRSNRLIGYRATSRSGTERSRRGNGRACRGTPRQPIADDLIECGVRVFNPFQAPAGFDVVELRKQYAGRMAFYGNIDVKKMFAGPEELEAEIRHKVPVARQGGFIFHSDHSVPPQVSFQQYSWVLRTAREIFAGYRI